MKIHSLTTDSLESSSHTLSECRIPGYKVQLRYEVALRFLEPVIQSQKNQIRIELALWWVDPEGSLEEEVVRLRGLAERENLCSVVRRGEYVVFPVEKLLHEGEREYKDIADDMIAMVIDALPQSYYVIEQGDEGFMLSLYRDRSTTFALFSLKLPKKVFRRITQKI